VDGARRTNLDGVDEGGDCSRADGDLFTLSQRLRIKGLPLDPRGLCEIGPGVGLAMTTVLDSSV
jgi:hypothetical protein